MSPGLIIGILQYVNTDLSEFDEDDPLAGLLSDEDDDLDPKPKPKKSSAAKKTSSPGISSQGELQGLLLQVFPRVPPLSRGNEFFERVMATMEACNTWGGGGEHSL